MAQDAELKLRVSLDLGFFRQQLAGLGQATAGYSLPINIKFDRSTITKELRNLERALGKKKINIELNLLGGLTKDQLERIQGRLEALSKTKKVEIPVSIKNGATGKDADKVVASIKERLAQNQQIKQGGGKLRIETSVKPSITNEDIAVFKKAVKDGLSKISALEVATKLDVPKVEDLLKGLQKNINRQKPLLAKTSIKPSILSADVKAFKKAVESKLSGITVKVKAELEGISKQPFSAGPTGLAGLQEYMRSQGMGPTGGAEVKRRAMFEDVVAGATFKELQRMTQQANIAGRSGLKTKAQMQEALLQINDAAMEGILGNLQMRMKDPLPMKRGFLDQIARAVFWMAGVDPEYLRQQAAQRRALPGVNFPATVPSRPVSIGPSSTGRALSAGAGPAGMIGAAQAPAGLLPSITARSSIKSGVEALFATGGPQFPMAPSGKLALSTESLQARVDKILTDYFKIAEVTVKEIFNPQDLKRALNIFSYLPQALRDAESRTRQARIGITSAQGIAGLLPAAAGRAPNTYSTGAIGGESREQMMARRTAEAYARSALRGMDVMGGGAGRPPSPYSYAYRSARPTSAIIPYAQPGAIVPSPVAGEGGAVPPVGGGGGMRGMGGMGGFGRALGGVNLPGAGAIRELGQEFAFATQQVLLFGQAYKMLAFIQNFPAQVGAAVSQLQNFRNTLDAISPTAEEAASSNRLILDLVEKYNVPLQSARDGFTKLYASMAPAGFSGDEIRDLFTGITQAAATFGMSADKVDRVNYAFAQMASKGQVMSEELKGQLGDVLPGAMALFAEAAGFEGPKAIQDFSQALEDGAYKGEAMVALLKNVGVIMQQEFGPGAEGAARTFQGVINRMQNSMTLLYESFEPVAVGFLNSVVVPLTSGIKQISDGFNAFFTGTTAKTAGGGVFAQQLQQLKPSLDGIRQNIQDLLPLFNTLGQVVISLGKTFIQLTGNPFVGYLLRTYAAVLPLVSIIKILNLQAIIPMIASVMRAIPAFVAFNAAKLRLISTNKSLQLAMQLTGTTAGVTAGRIRLMGAALAGLIAPAVLLGIGALIERFMMLKGAVDGVRQSTQQMVASISSMANTGAVKDLRNVYMTTQQQIRTFEGLRPFVEGGAIGPQKKLDPRAARKMEEVGLGSFISRDIFGKPYVSDFVNASKIIEERLKGLRKQASAVQEKFPLAEKIAADLAKQAQKAQEVTPIPEAEGDGKTKKGKELDQYIQDATNALKIEKESQLLAIEDRMLRKEISESEAKQQSLLVEKLFEEKAIKEALRVATLKNNEANLSAADKALKLSDMRKEAAQELDNIQKKYGVETLKVQLALQQPLENAISNVNEEITKQAMLSENLGQGFSELSADQKAYLDVQALVRDYTKAEKEAVADLVNEYQRLREEYYKNEEVLKKRQALVDAETELGIIGGGLRAGFTGSAAGVFERAMQQYGDTDYATQLANIETSAMQLRSVFEGLQGAIAGVSGAFANMLTEGITSMISGTATAKEVFASFLQSVGQALSQAASQMIATYIAIGIAKMFAGLGGGGGNPAGSGGGISDILPGASKYMEGGGAALGASAGTFGAVTTGYANGGIVPGGFRAFANGGVVSGPTLGLVGEGKYNEAVVPLPDGRSIPVQLGGRSARDLMGNGAPGMPQAPSLSMKFETTKINGVEYVSREQLEQAMAETRRASIAGGAQRGMSMTLDKIKQSPSTRSSIGIR